MQFVYVVKRSDLFPFVLPDGAARLDQAQAADLIRHLGERGFFVERRHAELDPEFKQVIPYCVVAAKGAILAVRRLRKQSEKRLHGLWSIGIGGHIEPEDVLPSLQISSSSQNGVFSEQENNLIHRAARRELLEELECPSDVSPRLIGWLNDDSNAVGKVHLGIVFLLSLSEDAVSIRETERMEGGFFPPDEIAMMDRKLETWSQLVLDAFHPNELRIA
jgi:predicted NUDIX family phosphoesterase